MHRPMLAFHPPFKEFKVARTEDLLQQLERLEPKGSKVEASIQEDTTHVSCMQPLTNILIHTLDAEMGKRDIHILYQYCPHCKVAVRVL